MLRPSAVVPKRFAIATKSALAGLLLLVLGTAGCGGSSAAMPSRTISDATKTFGTAPGPSGLSQTAVYVSDANAGMFLYPINPDGTLGSRQTVYLPNMGGAPPNVLAFGPDSGFYTVGHYANKIFFFKQGASGQWIFTYYLEPIYHSDSVVIDGKAYVYASGVTKGGATQVQVYPPGANGNVKPVVVIPGDSSYCCDVAVWAEQLYVSGNGIRVFSKPYSTPVLVRTITGATPFGGPVTLDKSSELYVGNGPDILAYSPFANGKAKPDRVIYPAGSPTLGSQVSMTVIGSTLYVYGLAHNGSGAIWVFDATKGAQTPKQVVTGMGSNPMSMAIGPLVAPQSNILNETFSDNGGTLTVPPYGGFTGSIGYAAGGGSGDVVQLETSTTNIHNAPLPPSGTVIMYLQMSLPNGPSSFCVGSGSAFAGFSSSAILPSRNYTLWWWSQGGLVQKISTSNGGNGSVGFDSFLGWFGCLPEFDNTFELNQT
jgi:hypothetical protein